MYCICFGRFIFCSRYLLNSVGASRGGHDPAKRVFWVGVGLETCFVGIFCRRGFQKYTLLPSSKGGGIKNIVCYHLVLERLSKIYFLAIFIIKHCQRHNGPEGWVLLTKITSFVISKILHKFWSNFITRISTKHQLQNLSQISAFRLNLNFKILTKPSFRISTKIKLHNLHQASTAK